MTSATGPRLKQYRLAQGLSLDALAEKMGGLVTKQALSQFENGSTSPSPRTQYAIARALGISAPELTAEQPCEVTFVAYRKLSSLRKREQARIESRVRLELEQYVRLQRLTAPDDRLRLPTKQLPVTQLADAEKAAAELRRQWKIGVDPIGDLVATLEDKHVYVCQLETGNSFDGISAFAAHDLQAVAAMVVTRSELAGERQRMNLAHELGHLVLKPSASVDEEKAAFRFAAGLLAPAHELLKETGSKRTSFEVTELLLLKRKFGISIQALLYRLRELDVISEHYAKSWWVRINRLGWRKAEPEPMAPERPTWLRRQLLRAVSEGVLAADEAERILGKHLEEAPPQALRRVRDLTRRPLAERRRVLAAQAAQAADSYETDSDWVDAE